MAFLTWNRPMTEIPASLVFGNRNAERKTAFARSCVMQQSDTGAFETGCGAMAQEGPGSARREGLTVVQPFQAFPDNAVAKRRFEQQPRPEARFCLHCGLTDAPAVARRKFVPCYCRNSLGARRNGLFRRMIFNARSGRESAREGIGS